MIGKHCSQRARAWSTSPVSRAIFTSRSITYMSRIKSRATCASGAEFSALKNFRRAESVRDERPGNERPDVRLLPIVLHRHRCLISEDDLAGHDQRNDSVREWRDQFPSAVKQIGHG